MCLKKKGINEYFILPYFTMFGDYQILLGDKAQETYISSEDNETCCMCMKKGVLRNLLILFPDVGEHFRERARLRKIEFKRVNFKQSN